MGKFKGILYTMISAVAFGIMPILAKITFNKGANAFTIVFFRSFWAIFMLWVFLLYKKISFRINKEQIKTISILGIIGYTCTTLTLFLSYNYISVGLATTLHFIYPILVTIASIILFKEKIYSNKILAVFFSAAGIFLLIGKSNAHINIKGIFLALLSGAFYSYYILGIAHSKIKNMNNFLLTFYLSIAAVIFLFFTGIFTHSFSFKMQTSAWIISIIIAFLTSILAVIFFQLGIKMIGASNASILSTLEPITSIILGVILLHENISFKTILGSILIIMSVILITLSERKRTSSINKNNLC